MALQSALFRGDVKLEACLVHDSAHVKTGAVGEHVTKVQVALATLDGVAIAGDELSRLAYGPSTATAVLAFKRQRNIINRSYQKQADDIVGKMTIAALDREMCDHEKPLGPCGCCVMNQRGGDIAPSGMPPAPNIRLNFILGQVGAPPAHTSRDMALAAVPTAQFWASGAISEIETMLVLRETDDLQRNPSTPFPSIFNAINTHFHLDRDRPHLRQTLRRIREVLSRIQRVLAEAPRFFQNGPRRANSPWADASMGGFQLPGTRFNHITFRPDFVTIGPNTRAAILLHEGAHFVGGINVINHFATEFPVPQGAAQGPGHTRNYQALHTDEALRNASSYAAYAIHATTLADSRFGARDPTL